MQALFQSLNLSAAYDLIQQGGFVVAILLGLSLIATTLIILKIIQIIWFRIGNKSIANRAVRLWISGQRAQAYDAVKNNRNPTRTALAHLMRGLNGSNMEPARMEEDVQRVAMTELGKLRIFMRPLETIVQIAPLLGLFGTVLGMIEAFQTLQNAGSAADPAVLAGGIWVALLTTAVGLAIAIPVAFFVSYFEGRIEAERMIMQDAITSLLTNRMTEAKTENVVASHPDHQAKKVPHAA